MIRRSLSFALLFVLLVAPPAFARDAGLRPGFNLEDHPLGAGLYAQGPARAYIAVAGDNACGGSNATFTGLCFTQ
ncbi:hypothetical protein BA190_32380 [Labrys sp. WJW]|uniref:hypothetical protein n=1 Tax=Labrys sp. WJW TaxID=1737983 RepID=UPI00082D7361|nr:hypothetical protein [Labrys sp. WJW]OCC00740.1 hypothetical protein BA190_32380 [Labrys sp. WJW]